MNGIKIRFHRQGVRRHGKNAPQIAINGHRRPVCRVIFPGIVPGPARAQRRIFKVFTHPGEGILRVLFEELDRRLPGQKPMVEQGRVAGAAEQHLFPAPAPVRPGAEGLGRVRRGGSFSDFGLHVRSGARFPFQAETFGTGFRVVCASHTPAEQAANPAQVQPQAPTQEPVSKARITFKQIVGSALFGCGGLFFVGIGLLLFLPLVTSSYFKKIALRGVGVVTGYATEGDEETSTRYHPLVTYTDHQGIEHSVQVDGTNEKMWAENQQVDILYNPEAPTGVEIVGLNPHRGKWQMGLGFVLFGSVFTLMGLAILVFNIPVN
mgnify:CR=1 FL=1